MIRYTTPTITLTVDAVIPEGANVYVSLKQKHYQLDKEVAATRGNKTTTVTLTLTQKESAAFHSDEPVYVQLNWITEGGYRNATKVASVVAFDNLLDKVIAYA